MQNSYMSDYINLIATSTMSLKKLKHTIACYEALGKKLGSEILAEAIDEVRDEKHKETQNDLEIFIAYEKDVKIIGLMKKYNITKEVAQVIVDLKISIFKAVKLSHIIHQKKLENDPDAVMLAKIILNYNLMGNPDAVSIANMMYKFGVPLDLAIEVCQYNSGDYKLRRLDEKYVFHKLRQIYQVKMQVEENFDESCEIRKISKLLNINSCKAEYLLVCCKGNNWGRNSSFYWEHKRFMNDIGGTQEYTDRDAKFIQNYIHDSGINNFARGFTVRDGKTVYNSQPPTKAFTTKGIINRNRRNYFPLYEAMNKYSLPKDVIVFRGTTIDSLNKYGIKQGDSEEEIKKKLNGHYHDGGFMSTSVVVGSLNFLKNDVNYIINLKAGTPCGELSKHTRYKFEYEVLIPPNVVFNVDDVKVTDTRIYIYLTSIPTKSLSYISEIKDDSTSGMKHL